MKKITAFLVIAFFSLVQSQISHGQDMGSIVKAQVVLGQVGQLMDKYAELQLLLDSGTVELEVEEPLDGIDGDYLLPFHTDGLRTEWAEKSLNASVGAEAGAAVGDRAASTIASKVPFGGLVGGFARKKTKELGAVTAIGGWDFIKETSSLSFNNLNDYSVYMHAKYNGLPEYEQALAAAMAIYPELEESHDSSVEKAYADAKKRADRL